MQISSNRIPAIEDIPSCSNPACSDSTIVHYINSADNPAIQQSSNPAIHSINNQPTNKTLPKLTQRNPTRKSTFIIPETYHSSFSLTQAIAIAIAMYSYLRPGLCVCVCVWWGVRGGGLNYSFLATCFPVPPYPPLGLNLPLFSFVQTTTFPPPGAKPG